MKWLSKTNVMGAMLVLVISAAVYVYLTGFGSGFYTTAPATPLPQAERDEIATQAGPQTLVLAGGCFWCTEAVFEQLAGVNNVVSGYAGGTKETADYETVSAGITDHAECVQITYDPAVITYGQLLRVFFTTAHDPTQLDYQGPDYGHQYRSTVFYQTQEQKDLAQEYIKQIDAAGAYPDPIATTLEPLKAFYPAEEYHQDYATRHPYDFYVRRWSLPKVRKTREKFPDLLRTNDLPRAATTDGSQQEQDLRLPIIDDTEA